MIVSYSNSVVFRRWAFWSCVLFVLFWITPELWARLGGGGGYSGGGGSGSSGGGGDGGEVIMWLIIHWFRFCWYYPYIGVPITIWAGWKFHKAKEDWQEPSRVVARQSPVKWDRLREKDSNFSIVLFRDFAYSIFARLHEARGAGKLGNYRQYIHDGPLRSLEKLTPESVNLKDVHGVVIGGLRIKEVRIRNDNARVKLIYEANYTEVTDKGEQGVYTHQVWLLVRRADVLSPPPDKISTLTCAGCGSPAETKPDGECTFCGKRFERGEHHWYVSHIQENDRRIVGPPLTSAVDDVGLDLPTVYSENLEKEIKRLEAEHPDFNRSRAQARFRHVFETLQNAWTKRDLNALRPFETDNLFQNHRYWIEEYSRQRLSNVLKKIELEKMKVVRVQSDKFYDAMTCRLWVKMIDYTVDDSGALICGSKTKSKRFSEYWTFIRGRGVSECKHNDKSCPSCGANLKISMSGICEYCDTKVTSGDFNWVLSEIQQDEEYTG
ncbi:MAG: Tim44-like domain-containing protein [Verrucomicrobiota bacterium]|nr:Tim44-like domain-containing protein [Verrucomicrobiota bacterium]